MHTSNSAANLHNSGSAATPNHMQHGSNGMSLLQGFDFNAFQQAQAIAAAVAQQQAQQRNNGTANTSSTGFSPANISQSPAMRSFTGFSPAAASGSGMMAPPSASMLPSSMFNSMTGSQQNGSGANSASTGMQSLQQLYQQMYQQQQQHQQPNNASAGSMYNGQNTLAMQSMLGNAGNNQFLTAPQQTLLASYQQALMAAQHQQQGSVNNSPGFVQRNINNASAGNQTSSIGLQASQQSNTLQSPSTPSPSLTPQSHASVTSQQQQQTSPFLSATNGNFSGSNLTPQQLALLQLQHHQQMQQQLAMVQAQAQAQAIAAAQQQQHQQSSHGSISASPQQLTAQQLLQRAVAHTPFSSSNNNAFPPLPPMAPSVSPYSSQSMSRQPSHNHHNGEEQSWSNSNNNNQQLENQSRATTGSPIADSTAALAQAMQARAESLARLQGAQHYNGLASRAIHPSNSSSNVNSGANNSSSGGNEHDEDEEGEPTNAKDAESLLAGEDRVVTAGGRKMKTGMQSKILKAFYTKQPRPSKEDLQALVNLSSLPYHEISRWFRNERHKDKKSREAKDAAITAIGNRPTPTQQTAISDEHLKQSQTVTAGESGNDDSDDERSESEYQEEGNGKENSHTHEKSRRHSTHNHRHHRPSSKERHHSSDTEQVSPPNESESSGGSTGSSHNSSNAQNSPDSPSDEPNMTSAEATAVGEVSAAANAAKRRKEAALDYQAAYATSTSPTMQPVPAGEKERLDAEENNRNGNDSPISAKISTTPTSMTEQPINSPALSGRNSNTPSSEMLRIHAADAWQQLFRHFLNHSPSQHLSGNKRKRSDVEEQNAVHPDVLAGLVAMFKPHRLYLKRLVTHLLPTAEQAERALETMVAAAEKAAQTEMVKKDQQYLDADSMDREEATAN